MTEKFSSHLIDARRSHAPDLFGVQAIGILMRPDCGMPSKYID